jgi:hypothetical protein
MTDVIPYGTRMVRVTDDYGRVTRVLIPEGAPDSDADHGLVLGPPDLTSLGYPLDIEVRLHNGLEGRGIITAQDAIARPDEIQRAIQSAFKASAQQVQTVFLEGLA